MPPFHQPPPSPPPQDPPSSCPPPLPPREVATGVSNLGNTCYINASIQALAHAPELCMALDIESHLRRCPVAERNEQRRRNRLALREELELDDHSSGESSEEGSRSSKCSNGSGKKKGKRRKIRSTDYDPDLKGDEEDEFCTLCEVERLLGRVHSRPEEGTYGSSLERDTVRSAHDSNCDPNGGPVLPETFVSGFRSHVAPWFRRGVQEDSHEFLRLLIDAMQNSCKAARRPQQPQQHHRIDSKSSYGSDDEKDDVEYPFRLFRGTVESNVTCSACRAVSCKIDPIEDVGLDILPIKKPASSTRVSSSRVGSNSRSTSPNNHAPLAAVQEALERFISIEHLDSGYKCEKCGKVGRATKTSKLASIPPILTLHLKRFRYGGIQSGGRQPATREPTAMVGPSGSAKIEGHSAFKPILDIKPYLTEELQETCFKKAFCRLFAVVVHNGKNSHSGHYVAYVNSLGSSNKEWWKMDDAKVTRASVDEVLRAEAYMLFYRVVDHPVSKSLGEVWNAKVANERRIREEVEARAREKEAEEKLEAEKKEASLVELETLVKKEEASAVDRESPILGKRKMPHIASGLEWAKVMTSLPSNFYPLFQEIQDFISENVTFNPDFFSFIKQEYSRMSSELGSVKKIKLLLGKGPSGVYPPEDVQDGVQDIHDGILDLFHMISILCKSCTSKKDGNGLSGLLLRPKPKAEEAVPVAIPLTVDQELIIPDPGEIFDGYDGAL